MEEPRTNNQTAEDMESFARIHEQTARALREAAHAMRSDNPLKTVWVNLMIRCHRLALKMMLEHIDLAAAVAADAETETTTQTSDLSDQ